MATVIASLGCGAEPELEPADSSHRSAPLGHDILAEPLPSEAECRECHPDVAAQWDRSRHHSAFTNPDFQRSFAREPEDFCRNCHAPGLIRAQPLAAAEAEPLGVGCLDCHGGDGAILTDTATTDATLLAAPHALLAVDEFGTRSCARCHEFEFPPTSKRRPGVLMQRTMTEHRASAFADRSCASCHLPVGDHSLDSTRDPAAMRAAITITARREHDDLVLELTPHDVGHAFPTGDLYRRLELHAERQLGGRAIASATRYLDREFLPWRYRDGRLNPRFHAPIVDDRITGPIEVRLELTSPDPSGGTLVWSVDYERVDARDDLDPSRSTIASEVRLAHGEL